MLVNENYVGEREDYIRGANVIVIIMFTVR